MGDKIYLEHNYSRSKNISEVLIPKNKYATILENIPIGCVDLVVRNLKGEILLVKRKNEPLKDQWCLPGGRIFRDELIEEAVVRKAKEELGILASFSQLIKVSQNLFDNSGQLNSNGTHVFDFICEVSWDENQNIILDSDHSEYFFFRSAPERVHQFVRNVF